MFDIEVSPCTRVCAATERRLQAGEVFFSVLLAEGGDVVRRDYCRDAWQGPPDDSVGWWRAEMPSGQSNKPKLAPNDVLLQLFSQWEDDASKQDMRYVLALLMIRRRLFRVEADNDASAALEELNVYCPRTKESHSVAVVEPAPERIAEIQEQLAQLLFAEAG